jgi:hypothetical protein
VGAFFVVFDHPPVSGLAHIVERGKLRIPVKPITDSSRSRSVSPVKAITYRSEATRVFDYGAK